MKAGTAVGRLPGGATGVPARAPRGSRETGNEEPAKLALRRESFPHLSDYPSVAPTTRGLRCCLWSSLPFSPTGFLARWPPHILIYIKSTARRCTQCRKQHAMRYATDRCAARTARRARPSRQERQFLFQECIATTGAGMRRSLSAPKQSPKRRTNAGSSVPWSADANGCFMLEKRAAWQAGPHRVRADRSRVARRSTGVRRPNLHGSGSSGNRLPGPGAAGSAAFAGGTHRLQRSTIDSSMKNTHGITRRPTMRTRGKWPQMRHRTKAFTRPAYRNKRRHVSARILQHT